MVTAFSHSDLESLVVFRIGEEIFALPVESVAEVVPFAWLARPPQMPAIVKGILNLGGHAVAVLRSDRLLGVAGASFGLDSSILVMKVAEGGAPVGLLVGHVEGVRPASAFQVMPLANAQSFQGCLSAELAGPGGTIHLVAWSKALLEEERVRLDDFQRRTQDRLMELVDAQ